MCRTRRHQTDTFQRNGPVEFFDIGWFQNHMLLPHTPFSHKMRSVASFHSDACGITIHYTTVHMFTKKPPITFLHQPVVSKSEKYYISMGFKWQRICWWTKNRAASLQSESSPRHICTRRILLMQLTEQCETIFFFGRWCSIMRMP